MKVTLRQRLKSKNISLYLDFYDRGKRKNEYLNLYLKPGPKLTKEEKHENKRILEFAEGIRAKRQVEIQNGIFGFENQAKLNASFLSYFELLVNKKFNSEGTRGSWGSTLKHLKAFVKSDITFGEVDHLWLQNFKEYLEKKAKTKSNELLSQNTKHSYFNKIKAALVQAKKEKIIKENPAEGVDSIKPEDPQKEFLTLEELKRLAGVDFELPLIKKVFLFSALTGFRWSDIEKLTWGEVQFSNELGDYIRFRQQKTKGAETHPICPEARELLGERSEINEKVFFGLKYSGNNNLKFQKWILKAGISKEITFHCARHTYATLQLTLGTDIYTVSKLLGHRSLITTQGYAKIVDEKKRTGANLISLK